MYFSIIKFLFGFFSCSSAKLLYMLNDRFTVDLVQLQVTFLKYRCQHCSKCVWKCYHYITIATWTKSVLRSPTITSYAKQYNLSQHLSASIQQILYRNSCWGSGCHSVISLIMTCKATTKLLSKVVNSVACWVTVSETVMNIIKKEQQTVSEQQRNIHVSVLIRFVHPSHLVFLQIDVDWRRVLF